MFGFSRRQEERFLLSRDRHLGLHATLLNSNTEMILFFGVNRDLIDGPCWRFIGGEKEKCSILEDFECALKEFTERQESVFPHTTSMSTTCMLGNELRDF